MTVLTSPFLQVLVHPLEIGTVKIRAGISVIHIELRIGKMMLFCIVHQVFFLVLYTVAVTFLFAVIL